MKLYILKSNKTLLLFHVIAFNKQIEVEKCLKIFENYDIIGAWQLTLNTCCSLYGRRVEKSSSRRENAFKSLRKSSQCMLNKHGIDGYFDNISPPRCMVNCDKPFRLIERIFPFHYLCVNFHFWLFFQLREFLNYTENWIIFNETYPLWLAFQKKRRGARGEKRHNEMSSDSLWNMRGFDAKGKKTQFYLVQKNVILCLLKELTCVFV